MALIDFTLSNSRRFYSSMGNPLGVKGLRRNRTGTLSFCARSNSKHGKNKLDELPTPGQEKRPTAKIWDTSTQKRLRWHLMVKFQNFVLFPWSQISPEGGGGEANALNWLVHNFGVSVMRRDVECRTKGEWPLSLMSMLRKGNITPSFSV